MKIGGLASWFYISVFCGVVTACFGDGDTRPPGINNGGSGGGGGGGSGAMELPCASKADAVRDAALDQTLCPTYATVTAFEKAILIPASAGCANTATCHGASTSTLASKKGRPYAEPLIPKTDAFLQLAGVKARDIQFNPDDLGNLCRNDAYIDLVDPGKSLILAKVTQTEPKCPSDDMPAGEQMPNSGTKLSDEQVKCLEAYVTAVSEGCRP